MVIREAQVSDAPAIAKVHVDTWRSTYRGIVADDHLERLSYDRAERARETRLADAEGRWFVFVAENEAGHIVGFADGGRAREEEPTCDGELYAIYILEPYQRQGIGRLLVRAVARRLHEMQIHSMAVWVLKDNPACGFYERLGGRRVATKAVNIGGRDYEEVCYCWDDVAALLEMPDTSRRS